MDDGKKTAESAPESVNEAALPDAAVEQMDPVAHLEASLSEAQDKYLRLYSEFENYKKRVARDRVDQSRMAAADTWSAILPVIDDFERAIKATQSLGFVFDGVRVNDIDNNSQTKFVRRVDEFLKVIRRPKTRADSEKV